MTEKPETPDFAAMIADLGKRFDDYVESVKPKPERSDRDVLDSIADGLAKLPETLGEILKGSTPTVEPPPARQPETPPAETDAGKPPARKGNPFTRHQKR